MFITANKLYKIPVGVQSTYTTSSINISQIHNKSIRYEEQKDLLKDKCQNKENPSVRRVSTFNHHNEILNHLGFVLRSHSMFYCSVPKVATRTLLTYMTFIHIRDELIPSLTNQSIRFDADYLNTMLANSIKVNIERFVSIFKSNLI